MESSLPFLDCLELRLDHLREINESVVEHLVRHSPLPVIATLRPERHGGLFQGEERLRLDLLKKAALCGAAVDLEDDIQEEILQEFRNSYIPVILSYHNFQETPDDVIRIYDEMRSRNVPVVKIATRVQNIPDLLKLYSLRSREGIKILAGMGETGQCTRILASRFGSALSFAVLNSGKPSAPGQIPAQDMVKLYRVREIRSSTKIYGVLGWPVAQSLSPVLHNTCFQDQKWDGVYVPLGSPTADGLRDFGESIGFKGFSVTHPHKQRISALCDREDASAISAGIANTIVVQEGEWVAHNTDLDGFIRPLERQAQINQIRGAVYGSGGAASAAVCSLRSRGARVTVVSRNSESGKKLAERFQAEYQSEYPLEKACPDVLVNATPVGMYPNPEGLPFDLRKILKERNASDTIVYDMVYNPRRTGILRQAEELGCRRIYGLEMFVEQAARQFFLWTGAEMPRDMALQAVTRALEER